MIELADIFRRHGPEYRAKFQDRMPQSHLDAMEAIEQCRTEALGGQVYQCMACGEPEYSYHSCQNRHCPKCHTDEATQWLEKPRELLLPVPSCLVTFTLPEELRPVARSQQKRIDNLLFQTSAAALKVLAMAPPYLGGQIGMVGVLHTWTRAMAYHPHIPSLVPGGAPSPQGSPWLSPRDDSWLVPVRALSKIFRGQFTEALTKAGLLDQVPSHVGPKEWVTHGESAGTGTEVLTYLAPYIRRIAITNNRIDKLEDGQVTFRFKESGSQAWKHLTLPAEERIRRFLQHVLPKGLIKVSYYGFLSPHCRQSLAQIRRLLEACPSHDHAVESGETREGQETQAAPEREPRCRKCGGPLVLLFRLSPTTRGPPS
jgi:DNA-directed RNA polymerase subunit M/transcription elongation factor TFIIS